MWEERKGKKEIAYLSPLFGVTEEEMKELIETLETTGYEIKERVVGRLYVVMKEI